MDLPIWTHFDIHGIFLFVFLGTYVCSPVAEGYLVSNFYFIKANSVFIILMHLCHLFAYILRKSIKENLYSHQQGKNLPLTKKKKKSVFFHYLPNNFRKLNIFFQFASLLNSDYFYSFSEHMHTMFCEWLSVFLDLYMFIEVFIFILLNCRDFLYRMNSNYVLYALCVFCCFGFVLNFL